MRHTDGEEQSGTLRLKWSAAGIVALEPNGKLKFPQVSSAPGLYKFCLAKSEVVEHIYIGESDNLTRRFAHYRNPGPTQQTNIYLNKRMTEHLREAGTINVLVSVQDCWIGSTGNEGRADLGSKLVRRMFEHFAAATHAAGDGHLLNR